MKNKKLINMIITALLSILLLSHALECKALVIYTESRNLGEEGIPFLPSFDYTPHPFIKAFSNNELANLAPSGAGTPENPYLFEGFNITTIGGIYPFYLANITVSFAIRDCWISSSNYANYHGIYLENLSDCSFSIENTVCVGNDKGIFVNSAYRTEANISNNFCYENNYGMDLEGLFFSLGGNRTIRNNYCEDNQVGIYIFFSSNLVIEDNHISNNLYEGLILYFSTGIFSIQRNEIINNSLGLHLFDCSYENAFISNNIIQFNGVGFYSYDSEFIFTKNEVSYSNGSGVIISRNTEIINFSENLIMKNGEQGVFINDSFFNLIFQDNLFYENEGHAFYSNATSANSISFVENSILGNNINGTSQGYDSANNVHWSVSHIGNRWSDWNGSSSYDIDGPIEMIDNYPLVFNDFDKDLMDDLLEYELGLDPRDSGDAFDDLDEDGLTNVYEFQFGLNLTYYDTDYDEISDFWEVTYGFDPLNYSDWSDDPDQDFLVNLFEYMYGTNPHKEDTDNDGYTDTLEIIEGTDPLNDADFPDGEPDVTVTSTVTLYNTTTIPCSDVSTQTTTHTETETTTEDGASLNHFFGLIAIAGGILVIQRRKYR
ncbi:MAG: right-handed parallel beta-helix repeat-containing protein [Candidatus Kariarchaeaceae archaeon]